MKKQYMLLVVLIVSMITARAQSSSTTIQYNAVMQPALVLELPNTTKDAEGTILEKLKQTGYNPQTEGHFFWKDNKIDGFYIFKNVTLPSLSSQKLDMYFKVVQKNRQEKDNSTVYLLVSTGNENFASPTGDTILWNSAVAFLNSFVDKTTAYNLEQSITNQENTVKDAQKKLANLQKDEKDLANQVKKYQEGLATNQSNQKDQQVVIDNQIKLLEDLKLKRKG
jgi:hypothetical protein